MNMKPDKSPETIKLMFDKIAKNYDFFNDLMSLGLHRVIKYRCVKELSINNSSKVLDLCCGTGDLSRLAKRYTESVTGLDFSEKMIYLAQKYSPDINFILSDATNLPFKNSDFDFVIMGFGLRNIENTQRALLEIHRVLKKGGYFLHLDFGHKNFLSKCFDGIILLFAQKSDSYKYLIHSKQGFPPPDKLIECFGNSGFKPVKQIDFIFGIISAQILQKQ